MIYDELLAMDFGKVWFFEELSEYLYIITA